MFYWCEDQLWPQQLFKKMNKSIELGKAYSFRGLFYCSHGRSMAAYKHACWLRVLCLNLKTERKERAWDSEILSPTPVANFLPYLSKSIPPKPSHVEPCWPSIQINDLIGAIVIPISRTFIPTYKIHQICIKYKRYTESSLYTF